MPRINVEDQLRSDPDFLNLADEIGRIEAFGALLALWELGMSYWKNAEALIPNAVFAKFRFGSELVRHGFGIGSEFGVYCRGAKDRWHFLLSQSENGKRSAAKRKEKYGTAIPVNATNNPVKPKTKTEPSPNQTEPSSSSSSSSSKEEIHNIFEVRKTEKGEINELIDIFKKNFENDTLDRLTALNFLGCFPSSKDAVKFLDRVFDQATIKFPIDDRARFKYIKGAMYLHAKRDKEAFSGN